MNLDENTPAHLHGRRLALWHILEALGVLAAAVAGALAHLQIRVEHGDNDL